MIFDSRYVGCTKASDGGSGQEDDIPEIMIVLSYDCERMIPLADFAGKPLNEGASVEHFQGMKCHVTKVARIPTEGNKYPL